MSHRLATEADYDHSVYVRVACESGQYLLAHCGIGGHIGASRVEYDIDRATDLGRDYAGTLASARARGKNKNMVADTGTSLRSAVSPEAETVVRHYRFGGIRFRSVLLH